MGSTPHPVHEPEILPPGAEYTPPMPQQEVRRPRSRWAVAPATYALVGINCLVFVLMVLNHVSPISPTTDQLFNWGGNNAGAVLIYGQWARVIYAMFVHVGILHLATNMWCLWNLGLLAEPLMGSIGVIAVYLLTGAAGNLLSVFWNWTHPIIESGHAVYPVGAGASGAVFGIAGALIVLLKSTRLPVPAYELNRLRKSVIYFAAINLVLGLSISGGTHFLGSGIEIDNTAHIGGFTCGLLFAAPMVPRPGSSKNVFRIRLALATGVVIGVLVLFGFYIVNVRG